MNNTGNYNAGHMNTGNSNTGNWNTGDCNTGYWNTGNWNTGDWNTGDWNTGNWNTGFFCTTTPKARFFDEETNVDFKNLWQIEGIQVLTKAPSETMWIDKANMTEEEKEQHQEYTTTGGYLKELSQEELKKARQKWYDDLSGARKQAILDLPNFNAEKFEKCTLIDVSATKENNEKIKNKIAELEEEIKNLKEQIEEK